MNCVGNETHKEGIMGKIIEFKDMRLEKGESITRKDDWECPIVSLSEYKDEREFFHKSIEDDTEEPNNIIPDLIDFEVYEGINKSEIINEFCTEIRTIGDLMVDYTEYHGVDLSCVPRKLTNLLMVILPEPNKSTVLKITELIKTILGEVYRLVRNVNILRKTSDNESIKNMLTEYQQGFMKQVDILEGR